MGGIVSFWLFGKNELSAVLPHLNTKAKTGPARRDYYGLRWISADFADGSGAIVNDFFIGGAAARSTRSGHISEAQGSALAGRDDLHENGCEIC